jgi:hypothetical protein
MLGFMSGTLEIQCRDGFRTAIKASKENFYPGYYMLLQSLPAPSRPDDISPAALNLPLRRICLVRAIGCFVLAAGIMTLPLLAPVDDFGWYFCLSLSGLCTLLGVFNLWRRRNARF